MMSQQKYRRASWPDDFDEIVIRMRTERATWDEIGTSFGTLGSTVYQRAKARGLIETKPIRRFTPEEDSIVREAYVGQRDLAEVAAQLGRSYGVVRQRIYGHHKDLLKTVRTPRGTRALKRYGASLLAHGATPDEAAVAIKEKLVEAKAMARAAAIEAKQRFYAQTVATMHREIAAGKARDTAIFEARAAGLSLERIGAEYGLTRERIRQVCDAEAMRIVLEQDAPQARDVLYLASSRA